MKKRRKTLGKFRQSETSNHAKIFLEQLPVWQDIGRETWGVVQKEIPNALHCESLERKIERMRVKGLNGTNLLPLGISNVEAVPWSQMRKIESRGC